MTRVRSRRALLDASRRLAREPLVQVVPSALAFLYALPRFAPSYVAYLCSSLVAVNYRTAGRRSYALLLGLLIAFFTSFGLSATVTDVSPTAFLLELALLLPLLVFLAGFRTWLSPDSVTLFLRTLAVVLCALSVVNIGLSGAKLPYIDASPDVFSGLYGPGGSKIVTVAGFAALANELGSRPRNWLFLGIALIDFVVPSYILGIAAGVAALGFTYVRRPRILLLVGVVVLLVSPYVIGRVEHAHDAVLRTTGYPAKVYAYVVDLRLYTEEPSTLVFGTGPGQFSSTPALWSSDYVRAVSRNAVPSLPGLFMTSMHERYLGPVLKLGLTDFWSISSSVDKPYTSISTLLAEYGLPLAVIVALLFVYRAIGVAENSFGRAVVIFIVGLFLVDVWHDSPFVGALLLLATARPAANPAGLSGGAVDGERAADVAPAAVSSARQLS